MGFLWKYCSVKGLPQAGKGEFRGLPAVVAGILGFLSSWVSTWGTRSCLIRRVRSPLALCGALGDSSRMAAWINKASSRVEVGTSGFLSISDIELGVSAELDQGSQASSCVEAWNSACLSCFSWVSGHLSSCIWNLQLFPEEVIAVSVPLCVVTSSRGYI